MKKLLLIFLGLIFLIILLFCFYYLPNRGCILKSYAIYDVIYTLSLKNNTGKPADIFAVVPQIKSAPPYQKIYDLSVNRKYKIISTQESSKSYLVRTENLKPGAEEKIQIKFKARICNIEQKLNLVGARHGVPLQYLRAEPDIESDSPLIKNTAEGLTKNEDNDYYKLIKLYDFVREKLTYREGKNCSTALDVLKTRQAQCADSALLLIALCRSIGIPAKFEAGIFYNDEDGTFSKTHAWAKIYTKNYGWLYIDPTLGRFNPEARFYCLAELRDKYITLWEDSRAPFSFYLGSSNADKNKIDVKLTYEIKKVICRGMPTCPEPAEGWHAPTISKIKNTPPQNIDKLTSLGLLEYSKNNLNKAKDYFARSFTAKPNSPAYKMYISCAQNSNRLKQTETEFKKLSADKPGNPYYLYCLGLINAYENNYSVAENYFKKAINLGLKDEYIYNSLAYIYIQTKQTDLAEKYLTESLKYSTHYKNSFENLIYLALIQQNWHEVIFWSLLAMKYNPGFDFNGRCGYAYLNLNNYAKAEEYIMKALKNNPQNTWLNLLLGKIYYLEGDKNKAYKQMSPFMPGADKLEKEEFAPLYEKTKAEITR